MDLTRADAFKKLETNDLRAIALLEPHPDGKGFVHHYWEGPGRDLAETLRRAIKTATTPIRVIGVSEARTRWKPSERKLTELDLDEIQRRAAEHHL